MPVETNGETVTGCSAPDVSMYIASDVLACGIGMLKDMNLGLLPNNISRQI